jgi:SAM-dependent MidA family methyltransferase
MPFGEQGDFITAPECGSVFGRCLARSIVSVLEQVEQPDVLEVGAGSGVLAVELLREFEVLGTMPQRYCILERSAAMRAIQQETLDRELPQQRTQVIWLDELPAQPLSGVIFANEVADALPVKRFRWQDGRVREIGVARDGDRLTACERAAGTGLARRVERLARASDWPAYFESEYCPALQPWIRSLADCIDRGMLLLVDYGYGRSEYYHPQRSMGTLICHYRHHAHGDPFWFPGLQDITAFVDFTAVAEAADVAGLQLQGYTSQAQFLLGCGIDQLMSGLDPGDARGLLQLSNEIKRLMLPGEMGDRFKAIGCSRGLQRPVRGFGPADLRSRL